MTGRLEDFIAFSVELTCFSRFALLGTGQAEAYLDAADQAAGSIVDELLDCYRQLPQSGDRSASLRTQILGDEKLGPVARAIVKMWYIGIWYALPRSWTQKYGAGVNNMSFMVSPASYAEGLLWPAIGAHPPGAKAPGYGSWADPPVIPAFGRTNSNSTGPMVTQTEPGHVSPHHAAKPQHPPPVARGPST